MERMSFDQIPAEFFQILMVIGVIGLALMILMIVSFWRIFEKAGKPGWAAIIPIYSTLVMLEIVRKPWWWLLLMMIPYAGIIWAVWMLNLLSKSFGKDEGYTVGMVLLPYVFFPLLAFTDAQYVPLESNPDAHGNVFP